MSAWLRTAGLMLLGVLVAANARAETLDAIRTRGTLVWGADQEGGGPYVYPDPADPSQMRGFEYELAEILAERLGVRSEFYQGQWDKLPDLLARGDIDIVLNGYEWSEVWAERFGMSLPYYIYELQLLARRDDASLRSLDDLRRPTERGKRRVAALSGSAAHAWLESEFGDAIDIVLYDGVTDAMRAVELGIDGVDATLQDTPIVTFYLDGFPKLARVGAPVGRGYYVIFVRKDDSSLLRAINDVIVEMLRDGSLRRVLRRYGLWNDLQQSRMLETSESGQFSPVPQNEPDDPTAPATAYQSVRGIHVVAQRLPFLLQAAMVTVGLAVLAMPLAILMGLLLAVTRLYGPRPLARLATTYIEVIRGTPLVLQLFVIFFLLPETGYSLDAFWAAVLGLAINYSAYEAEIYRAGLLAIPRGQMEAATALGMSRPMALRRVIIPQATRLVIPPVTNDFIALFKDTAVCSVITVVELSKGYYIHARSTGAVIELGLMTALLYLAMSYPLAILTGYLEKRLHPERRR